MKTKILACFFVLIAMGPLSAQDLDINKTDSKGLKQGQWEEKTATDTIKGRYVDNVKDGSWATYLASGNLQKVESYTKGILDGVSIEVDQRGYLVSEMYYLNNLLEGQARRFFYGTNPASLIDYKHGKINGKKKIYYESNPGKLMEESNYVNDVKEGPSAWYSANGDPIAEYTYVNGLLEGVVKSYYPGKKIMSEQTYSKNVESGPYTEYYENGSRKTTGSYANGQMSGLWQEFDEKGIKVAEGNYLNGMKEGKWSEFNAEGKVIKTTRWEKGVEK